VTGLAARAREIRAGIEPVRLRQHVERLAGPRGRRHAPEALARAEGYVTGQLEEAGWRVERRAFRVSGIDAANLVARRPAGATGTRGPAYLVGAHLDTVPGSPGADDNASGVAGLLELARVLAARVVGTHLDHALLLAVFDEEEAGLVGADVLAEQLVAERILAGVLVFESVGYFPGGPRTQLLPPGAGVVFPRLVRRIRRRGYRGEWTLLAYRQPARALARRLGAAITALSGPESVVLARDPVDYPVLGAVLRRYPRLSGHFARSDHKPFWDRGVPAVQLTDTADFRNPNYHQPSDTPDTLDYERMADLVAATAAALLDRQPADG
jgi:Zn-dependent M28 family amino/carboxypeptidase